MQKRQMHACPEERKRESVNEKDSKQAAAAAAAATAASAHVKDRT